MFVRFIESNLAQSVANLPTRYLPPGSIRLLYYQMNKPQISPLSKKFCFFFQYPSLSKSKLLPLRKVLDVLEEICCSMGKRSTFSATNVPGDL